MTPLGLDRLARDENEPLYIGNQITSMLIWDETALPVEPSAENGYPTIGFGRNLVANPLSKSESLLLLSNDVAKAEAEIFAALPWIANISPVARDVLTMVQFNTGNVLAWHETLAALKAGDNKSAASALLNSKAAKELPERYKRMSDALTCNAWSVTI
jgi:lysozyme